MSECSVGCVCVCVFVVGGVCVCVVWGVCSGERMCVFVFMLH